MLQVLTCLETDWWLLELVRRSPLADPKPKPSQLVPLDLNLEMAGMDAAETIYSLAGTERRSQMLTPGKDNHLNQIRLFRELPTGYVTTASHQCVIKANSQEVCLIVPTDHMVDMFFAYDPKSLPPQFIQHPKRKPQKGMDWNETNLVWLQQHPHLSLDWPQFNRPPQYNPLQYINLTSTDNRFTIEEWAKMGSAPITNLLPQDQKLTEDQVATFQTQPYSWQLNIPVTTLEEAEAIYGLTTHKVGSVGSGHLCSDKFQILDRRKATKLFPAIAHLPQITAIEHKYSGFCLEPTSNNLKVLAKVFTNHTLGLSDGKLRIETATEIDSRKLVGYLCDAQSNHAYTTKQEYTKWFIPVKEARKLYQGITTNKQWYVHMESGTSDSSYLLSDLADATRIDHKDEKKKQGRRRAQLISEYPYLPRHWKEHTDIRIWQDIHKKRLSGEISKCTLIPLFGNMQHTENRYLPINQWFAANDPQHRYDPIEKNHYCPAYTNFDEIADLPNFDKLISELFPDPLIAKLIISEKSRTVLITNLLT